MDHEFNEVQELLAQTARDFFARAFPMDRIRDAHRFGDGFDAELWPALQELGWSSAPFPESMGGSGGGLLDIALVIEEMGKGCAATPFLHSTVAAGLALVDADPGLAQRVASGDATVIPAITNHPDDHPSVADGTLSGRAIAVPWANLATHYLVAIGGDNHMAVVEAGTNGVAAEPMPAADGDPLFDVRFRDAMFEIIEAPGLVRNVLALGAAAEALMMLGLCQRSLELASEYSKGRIAFGQPIGSFQAISHKCANMAVDIEVGRYLCYKAAWLHGIGEPYEMAARYAKAFMGEATARITRDAIQVHGGVGYIDDHFVLFPYRLGTAAAGMYGTAHEHRRAVADAVLA